MWSQSGLVRQAIGYSGDIFQPMAVLDFPFDKHCLWINGGPIVSRINDLALTTSPDPLEVDPANGCVGGWSWWVLHFGCSSQRGPARMESEAFAADGD